MRIVIAGGTGFLGRPLVAELRRRGHDTHVLTRRPQGSGDVPWDPDAPHADAWRGALDGADGVINLAGESIAGARWSSARKDAIRHSRIAATRALATAILAAGRPPAVLLSGSAVGVYGARGDEPVDETAPPGSDFLASVCRDWETEASRAADVSRVVLLRTGLVLGTDGGALPPMLPPFRLYVGGRLGSGRQYWPWIHRADWIAMVCRALEAAISGPLNVVAPDPVTNAEFASTLGRVLRRPAWIPMPGIALRLLFGEMADPLMLTGARVIPAKAQAAGFTFRFPSLDLALRDLLGRAGRRPVGT